MLFSLMKDKDLEEFVSFFEDIIAKWVVCTMKTPRSLSGDEISKRLLNHEWSEHVLYKGKGDQQIYLMKQRLGKNSDLINHLNAYFHHFHY